MRDVFEVPETGCLVGIMCKSHWHVVCVVGANGGFQRGGEGFFLSPSTLISGSCIEGCVTYVLMVGHSEGEGSGMFPALYGPGCD